nr:hypothetical protein [uncultured Sediminibacterium sp.]
MNVRFGSNKLTKQLGTATAIKSAFGLMARKVSARLDDIRAAPNLAVLMQLPQAGCHPLKADRAGEWAVSISVNHRMIFKIDHYPVPVDDNGLINTIVITDIVITGTEDYH